MENEQNFNIFFTSKILKTFGMNPVVSYESVVFPGRFFSGKWIVFLKKQGGNQSEIPCLFFNKKFGQISYNPVHFQ